MTKLFCDICDKPATDKLGELFTFSKYTKLSTNTGYTRRYNLDVSIRFDWNCNSCRSETGDIKADLCVECYNSILEQLKKPIT